MLRPVWYFVDYAGDKIANIYGMGNPILWWLGIPAIVFTAYHALKNVIEIGNYRDWIFNFLAPLGPRSSHYVLYHYLPSVPFSALLWPILFSKLPRWATITSSILILGAFIYFYPMGRHSPS